MLFRSAALPLGAFLYILEQAKIRAELLPQQRGLLMRPRQPFEILQIALKVRSMLPIRLLQ
eukprot:12831891-Alexandrium_andersonii.AAC.1